MKKVKLFTTIASLCLAVALMAFGVYAALEADLGVSGSISFSATDIDGSWTAWSITPGTGVKADRTSGTKANATGIMISVDAAKEGEYEFTVTGTFNNTSDKTAILTAVIVPDGTGEGVTGAQVETTNPEVDKTTGTVSIKITFSVTDGTKDYSNTWSVNFHAAAKPQA